MPLIVSHPVTNPRSGPLESSVWWSSLQNKLGVVRNRSELSGEHDLLNLVVFNGRDLVMAEAEPEEDPADLLAQPHQAPPQGLQRRPSERQVVVAHLGPKLDRGQLRSPHREGRGDPDQVLK